MNQLWSFSAPPLVSQGKRPRDELPVLPMKNLQNPTSCLALLHEFPKNRYHKMTSLIRPLPFIFTKRGVGEWGLHNTSRRTTARARVAGCCDPEGWEGAAASAWADPTRGLGRQSGATFRHPEPQAPGQLLPCHGRRHVFRSRSLPSGFCEKSVNKTDSYNSTLQPLQRDIACDD